MKKNAERILTATFCDDIRHEMGNKLSFMGCYRGELVITNAPVLLPKLCVYASASTPQGNPFKALTLRVVQDKDVELAKLDISADGLQQAAEVLDPTATRKTVSTAIVFSPFFIEKPTSIRLMATTEDGEIIGPRLLIKVIPSPDLSLGPVEDAKPAASVTTKKAATRKKAKVAGRQ